MVIDILVDMALDYVSEKAFRMSMDSAVHYALNVKDRRELKDLLDKEMSTSVNEIPVCDCTRQIIGSDGEYGTTFKKGIVNSVMMREGQPDTAPKKGVLNALMRKVGKEKDWFVNKPPIPENKLEIVKTDVDNIIDHMQEAMWGNALFRKIVGDEKFQEMVVADLDELKRQMAEIFERLERLEGKVSELSDKIDSLSVPVTVVPSPVTASGAFTGRGSELKALEEAVSDDGLVFVNGFGGIGKTELCRRFSSDYSKRTGCKVVWTTFEESIRRTIATNVRLSDESRESADIN